MKTSSQISLLRPLTVGGFLVLAGTLFLASTQSVRAEDNGDDGGGLDKDCPTWKTCDARCGAAPPPLDGTPEGDAAFDRYQECLNQCLREVFDCITQQAIAGHVVDVLAGGDILDPGEGPAAPDRGNIILPEVLDAALPMVFMKSGQAASSADTNGDGVVDLSDAVRLLNYLFVGGEGPATILVNGFPQAEGSPQRSADGKQLVIDGNLILRTGDTDGNGQLDLSDAVLILQHLFSDGKAPVEIVARAAPVRPPHVDPRLPPVVIRG